MSKNVTTAFGCIAALVTVALQHQAASVSSVRDRHLQESTTAITSRGIGRAIPRSSGALIDGAANNGIELTQSGPDLTGTATLVPLPSLGGAGPSEARAVDASGTIIVGYSWDRHQGRSESHAVKWTEQLDGSWVISRLPYAAGVTNALANGVNNAGDAAGRGQSPSAPDRALLWPVTGGVEVLGCPSDIGSLFGVYAISADAQVVVGSVVNVGAAVWQPGSCRTDLPPLIAGGPALAIAVNGDGTIIGGGAADTPESISGVPVRWMSVAGQWQIEQLDNRPGAAVGANATGDLGGYVYTSESCASSDGCQRAIIWWAAGGPPTMLGTLGGEDSWASDINASGEVVGGSTAANGVNTGYFWDGSTMLQLPFRGRSAAAYAVSDVRGDGTRVVVGSMSTGAAVAWVVRTP